MEISQALKDEYNDHEKHPRMIGTGGTPDYLVIAKDEASGMQLGIKPLFSLGTNQQGDPITTIGFRIRSAPISQTTGEASNVTSINGDDAEVDNDLEKKAPNEAFELPWENYPGSGLAYRASLIRMAGLNRSADEIRHVPGDVKQLRLAGKLYNFMLEHVPSENMTVSPDQLSDYIDVVVDSFVMKVRAATDPKAKLEVIKQQKVDMDAAYDQQIKKLEAEVEAVGEEAEVEYQPKAHYSEDFADPNSVVSAMIEGAKPNLSVVGNEDDDTAEAVAQASEDEENEKVAHVDFEGGEEAPAS